MISIYYKIEDHVRCDAYFRLAEPRHGSQQALININSVMTAIHIPST